MGAAPGYVLGLADGDARALLGRRAGFVPLGEEDLTRAGWARACTFRGRTPELERDVAWRQFATYCLLTRGARVWGYVRAAGDGRLLRRASLGVGGHVEHRDHGGGAPTLAGIARAACLRELAEEVGLGVGPGAAPALRGALLLDDDDVSRAHLGLVYTLPCPPGLDPAPAERGVEPLGWLPARSLAGSARWEAWSLALIPLAPAWAP
jgi:predicted NUDIX family phosphoesterase